EDPADRADRTGGAEIDRDVGAALDRQPVDRAPIRGRVAVVDLPPPPRIALLRTAGDRVGRGHGRGGRRRERRAGRERRVGRGRRGRDGRPGRGRRHRRGGRGRRIGRGGRRLPGEGRVGRSGGVGRRRRRGGRLGRGRCRRGI